MKIELWHIGKTRVPFVRDGIAHYQKKIRPYHNVKVEVIPSSKGKGPDRVTAYKNEEGEKLLKRLAPSDTLILLDEAGQQFTSVEFGHWLQKQMDLSPNRLVFVIGGAYGFSEEVYRRSQFRIALSKMTFPHELVRVLFMEQLYRGFTIINNKSYHHQ